MTTPTPPADPAVDPIDRAAVFIARWQGADGTELANYQLFVHDLATLLGVERPQPAREDTRDNAYVFERRVTLARGYGSNSEGRIDCYRRGDDIPGDTDPDTHSDADGNTAWPPTAGTRAPWPAALPEQIRLVADTVTQAARPLDLDHLAAHFTGRGPWKKRLPDIVDSLAALGRLKVERNGERVVLHG